MVQVSPTTLFAQQTVGDILASCSTKDRPAEGVIEMTRNLYCMGYLSGLFDGFVLTSEFVKKGVPADKIRLCTPPEGLENEKVVSLALESLRNGRISSLTRAWPHMPLGGKLSSANECSDSIRFSGEKVISINLTLQK